MKNERFRKEKMIFLKNISEISEKWREELFESVMQSLDTLGDSPENSLKVLTLGISPLGNIDRSSQSRDKELENNIDKSKNNKNS